MSAIASALAAFTALCNAYVAWVGMKQRERYATLVLQSKDELDKHTPSGNLRAALLSDFAKREATEPERTV